jgi:hypothetical protein
MLRQGLLAMLVMLVSAGSALAQQSLFFSEYIEGGGNNKAFEIYNPTDAAIDLGNYIVLGNYNGNPFSDTLRFPMGTMLESMDVYVVAHADAAELITSEADSLVQNPYAGGTSFMTVFNGDDARALVHIDGTDSTIIDMFGTTEEDPGSGWDVAGVSAGTKDRTLVRKAFIEQGNPTPLASFGVGMMSSEWEVYEKDDLTHIGLHDFGVLPTIRDLNTYPGITEFSVDAIQGHPLNGETITVTAVITSYPKSSGLSNPRDSDNDGVIDAISRIHVFVTDTHAVSMGREGMSIQLVESDYNLLESYVRGDIITFDATLGFFNGTAQVAVDNVVLVGNVNADYAEYASLLQPWEVPMSELNTFTGTELYMNIEGYLKYNGAYVTFPSATVTQAGEFSGRVDWSVNQGGSRMYVYDTSLRFRNDHAVGAEGYIPSYNARRIDGEDGPFTAPASGANVDISGFINYVGDNPDALVPSGNGALSINPFEDGVVWLNEARFVNGQDVGGTTFSWPNDLVVNGLPPVFSNIMLSDSAITSTDEVTVSADIVGAEGATIAGVTLTYSVGGKDSTVTMTNSTGDTYEFTLPAFPNFSAVSFHIEATDSEGLTGRAPLSGGFNFFVQDEPITTIEFLQKTGDGKSGDSPLFGLGDLDVNINATVVASAATDGFIVIQDKAAAWSGIFVEPDNATSALMQGDIINITNLATNETFGVTSAILNEFSKTGNNAEMDTLAMSTITQDVLANVEAHEGLLLSLDDVRVITNQADGGSDYGEWMIGSRQGGGAADTLEVGEGLRVDDNVNFGSTTYGSELNDHVKIGAVMDNFTGVLHYSFGNPKMILRSLEDITSSDWTLPISDFVLKTPDENATVVADADIIPTWAATSDLDGNAITYEWVLYGPDSTEIVAVPANDEGAATKVTLPASVVDGLLVAAGVADDASAGLLWNVRVSDGVDTLAVSSGYDNVTNTFTPIYRAITLTNSASVNNELVAGLPEKFDLKPNYPNPFNPSTRISFDLPESAEVRLTVFDVLGRQVANLVNQPMKAGSHTVNFDAQRLASGVYIYRLEAGSFSMTRNMMLIK